MSSVVLSIFTYLVILCACAFLLVRNIRHSFIIVFAVAALLRCVAFAPAALVNPGTSTSLPLIGIARVANFSSLVLFAAGFVMLALWLARTSNSR